MLVEQKGGFYLDMLKICSKKTTTWSLLKRPTVDGIKQINVFRLVLKCRHEPSSSSHVPDLHVEEGQEGVPTEGTGGVQVGVVGLPASHDLLVVHQTVTRFTPRAAGDQQLGRENTSKEPYDTTIYLLNRLLKK